MYIVALKMLLGDRAKYMGLVFGITFASLLMSHQVSLFIGIMGRTASQIQDISEADIWVMNPQMIYVDETKPMPDRDLLKVRSVAGVLWAVPFFKGSATISTDEGILQQVVLLGVDDASLIGQPERMILGNWENIKQTNALIMDKAGFEYIWPKQPLELNRVVEMNETRVVITGICESSPPFMTYPITYARYSVAVGLAPQARNDMTFILVGAQPGVDHRALAKRISEQAGLEALTTEDFQWRSMYHYLTRTAIPVNFGITVMLGFIVGAAIAGQTFYIFVLENLRQFGALKAIGVTNGQIMRMVLLQAFTVGFVGFGIGVGICATFFHSMQHSAALRGFYLHWQVILIALAAVTLIISLASVFSLRRVLTIDPAIVFR